MQVFSIIFILIIAPASSVIHLNIASFSEREREKVRERGERERARERERQRVVCNNDRPTEKE